MASPAQVKYMTDLAEKRDLTKGSPELNAWLNTPIALENATNAEVNLILAALKELPFKLAAPIPAPLERLHEITATNVAAGGAIVERTELQEAEEKVGKGHYFIVDPTDNVEKFFKVEKPEPPSRWTGYTFIKVQASDYYYPVKDVGHRLAILKTIAEDPIKAMNEYGIRLGVCGYCGRTLTARDSRLRGMGPICAGRILGQPTPEQDDILRKLGFK